MKNWKGAISKKKTTFLFRKLKEDFWDTHIGHVRSVVAMSTDNCHTGKSIEISIYWAKKVTQHDFK